MTLHELQSCLVVNEAGKSPTSQCCVVLGVVCTCRGVLHWPQTSQREERELLLLLIKEMKSNSCLFIEIRIICMWFISQLSHRAGMTFLSMINEVSNEVYLTELQLLQSHCCAWQCWNWHWLCMSIHSYMLSLKGYNAHNIQSTACFWKTLNFFICKCFRCAVTPF